MFGFGCCHQFKTGSGRKIAKKMAGKTEDAVRIDDSVHQGLGKLNLSKQSEGKVHPISFFIYIFLSFSESY